MWYARESNLWIVQIGGTVQSEVGEMWMAMLETR